MISNGFFYMFILGCFTFNSIELLYAQNTPEKKIETEIKALEADLFFLCKRDKNVRWLRAHKLENGKCNTLYSKEGYLQVIGSATYYSSCEGILHSVKKNLEEGGFVCNATPKYSVLEL